MFSLQSLSLIRSLLSDRRRFFNKRTCPVFDIAASAATAAAVDIPINSVHHLGHEKERQDILLHLLRQTTPLGYPRNAFYHVGVVRHTQLLRHPARRFQPLLVPARVRLDIGAIFCSDSYVGHR